MRIVSILKIIYHWALYEFLCSEYVESIGGCRGGASPDNDAGLAYYDDQLCRDRCDYNSTCTGYVIPVSDEFEWCETYTSIGATGDGNSDYKCYMKAGILKKVLSIRLKN